MLFSHGPSIIFYALSVYLWGAVAVGAQVCGNQRTVCESLLSPSVDSQTGNTFTG